MLSRRLQNPKQKLLSVLLLMSIGIFMVVTTTAFTSGKEIRREVASTVRQGFLQDVELFGQQAAHLRRVIILLDKKEITLKQARETFYRLKQAYKRVEYLLEYLNPGIAKNLNGAPLPKVLIEEERYQTLAFQKPKVRTFPAQGLQVLEELLFSDDFFPEDAKEAIVQAYALEENANLFRNSLYHQPLNDKQVLESLREEVVRIMTMGITGFDAPAAGKEIENSALALQPVLAVVASYSQNATSETNTASHKAALKLKESILYLQQHPDFETFDRVYFIRELLNPAYAALTLLQQQLLPQADNILKPINDKATGLFSADFLQTAYYGKQDRQQQSPELIHLGKTLFFDPLLSENNKRSCASCHAPDKAFADGLARSVAFDFKGTLKRNSPTLLNAAFSTAYFWDSRAQYLQDQIPDVLLKTDELHGNYEEVVQKLQGSPAYRKLFRRAFSEQSDRSLNANTLNRAIAAYVQSLVALNSPFDRYMRHETDILPAAAKRGFNLFMGKAACGTCHFAPIFNGTVPPRYLESESEVLGVPATANLISPTLDNDIGKAGVIPAEVFRFSFKTPTLRNAAVTAPYMHNGVFTTLTEVIEFYDRGGGAGLGLTVPHQTLPNSRLDLTGPEKEDLIAFMQSLTDTTPAASAPKSLPRFITKRVYNKRPVGGVY
jgi:cytochrome c peroxidase